MISTKSPNELPHPAQLREHCQAIALLDAILQPEESSRTFLYDPAWAESEELFSMDDHEGSSLHVWFSRAGVVIRGYAADSVAAQKGAVDVLAALPPALAAGRTEPAFGGEERATFAIFRLDGADAWIAGKRPRSKDADVDGSATLLAMLDGHPLKFIQYAERHYKTKPAMATVQPFYKRVRVRTENIRAVRSDANVEVVVSLARSLGFPTAESDAALRSDLGAASTSVKPPPAIGDIKGDAELSIVRDGRRTMLVLGGRVHAWVDDWEAFLRIRDYALSQMPERTTK